MEDMPYTKDVNKTAEQTRDKRQGWDKDDLLEAPSQTEHELTERMTFGRGDLEPVLKNLATGYFQEEEVAAVRKLADAYYRTINIEERLGIKLGELKKEQMNRITAIVQTSKSRNGFANKNAKTQRIRSQENVNEFRRDRMEQDQKRSAIDKIKDAITGQRSKELADSAMMDRDQLALGDSQALQGGRRRSRRDSGPQW